MLEVPGGLLATASNICRLSMWRQVPYNDMTPLQAAVGVVQKGLRPGIPPGCPPALGELLTAAWQQSPAARPAFRDLTPRLQVDAAVAAAILQLSTRHYSAAAVAPALQAMLEAAKEEENRQQAARQIPAPSQGLSQGLLSKLRGR